MSQSASSAPSSVGMKILMAVTGFLLVGFILGHLAGNLKAFQGPEKFDAYSHFLREVGYPALGHGEFLWIARLVLLAAVVLHIVAAVRLTARNRAARPVGYRRFRPETSSYASRTMIYGGVILALYVVYHVLHLTTGTVHPQFTDSAYANLVAGFQVWWTAGIYMVAQVALGLHLYHGVWSGLRTLGAGNPRWEPVRRGLSAVLAVAVTLGFLSIPVAVLAGVIR